MKELIWIIPKSLPNVKTSDLFKSIYVIWEGVLLGAASYVEAVACLLCVNLDLMGVEWPFGLTFPLGTASLRGS